MGHLDVSYFPPLFYCFLLACFSWYAMHILFKDDEDKLCGISLLNGFKFILAVFLIAVLSVFLFLSLKVPDGATVGIGAEQTAREAQEFVPPSADEIDEYNREALGEEEKTLDEKIEEEKKKSRKAYEEALRNAAEAS